MGDLLVVEKNEGLFVVLRLGGGLELGVDFLGHSSGIDVLHQRQRIIFSACGFCG